MQPSALKATQERLRHGCLKTVSEAIGDAEWEAHRIFDKLTVERNEGWYQIVVERTRGTFWAHQPRCWYQVLVECTRATIWKQQQPQTRAKRPG